MPPHAACPAHLACLPRGPLVLQIMAASMIEDEVVKTKVGQTVAHLCRQSRQKGWLDNTGEAAGAGHPPHPLRLLCKRCCCCAGSGPPKSSTKDIHTCDPLSVPHAAQGLTLLDIESTQRLRARLRTPEAQGKVRRSPPAHRPLLLPPRASRRRPAGHKEGAGWAGRLALAFAHSPFHGISHPSCKIFCFLSLG